MVLMQASLGASMLLWWGAAAYPALAAFALWMGLSYGGIVSLMPAMCMDLYGARAVSSTIGVLYTGAALGNVAGPWVAGRVFDAQGSYAAVILGCAVLSWVATYAGWRGVRC
jgi:predicted MFS family arabinose efflux permease